MPVQSAMCGTGRWFGTATGSQVKSSVRSCRSARISSCVPIEARRSEIRSACAGVKATKAASTTPPITAQRRRHAWSRGSCSQPSAPAPQKTASSAAGQQQVAAEDRQAGGGEHAEGGDRDEPGRDRQRGAPAHEGQDEDAARRGAEQAGLAQDLAEPARDGQRHGAEAGLALQHLGVVARAEQRVQRVAGEHPVVRHPDHGRGDREREQLEVALAGHVGEREQPRLGPQQAGEAEQDEREPRAAAARLGQDRAQHQRDVRDVQVGAHAEAQDRDPGQDHERGQRSRPRAEPVRAELVGQPRQRAQREEREHDPERLAEVPERRQHDAEPRSPADAAWGRAGTLKSGWRRCATSPPQSRL